MTTQLRLTMRWEIDPQSNRPVAQWIADPVVYRSDAIRCDSPFSMEGGEGVGTSEQRQLAA